MDILLNVGVAVVFFVFGVLFEKQNTKKVQATLDYFEARVDELTARINKKKLPTK